MKFKYLFLDCPRSSKCLGAEIGVLTGLGVIGDWMNTRATNDTNYNINAMNNKFNREEAQKTREWNEKMTREERAYNDPNAVRERLERAGVNPNFADLGTGEASTVTGGATAEAASPIAMQAHRFNIGQALQAYSQVKSMEADASLKAEQAKLVNAQGVNQEAQNEYIHQQKQLELINLVGDYRQKASQSGLSDSQKRYYEKMADTVEQQIRFNNDTWDDRVKAYRNQNANIEADTNLKIKQTALTATQNTIAEVERKYKVRFTEAQISGMEKAVEEGEQRIRSMAENDKLTKANVNKVTKETAKVAAEALGIDNNNRMYPLVVEKLKSEIFSNRGTYGRKIASGLGLYQDSEPYPVDGTSSGSGFSSGW